MAAPQQRPPRTLAEGTLRRMPTQGRALDKVNRALDAAERLLHQEGVDAITMPRVAEEAGVSVGALYQYLPDREAIVAALSAEYHARLEGLMDDIVARHAELVTDDPVSSVIGAVAELYRDQSGTRALRAGLQSSAQSQLSRAHKQRMVAKVQRLLVVTGVLRDGQSEAVARTLFFAADALMHEAFAEDGGGDAQLLEQLTLMLRAYLSAVEGG